MIKIALFGLGLAMEAVVSAGAQDVRQVIVDDAWSGAAGTHFSGRMTEMRSSPGADQGRLKTLYRNTRLLLAGGEEGAVTWRVGDLEWSVRTDEEGYWEMAMNRPLALAPGWHEITSEPAASSASGLLVVDPKNTFGIISDLDDTVLVSDVLEKRTLLKKSLTVPPEHREAVPGMAALYQRLLKRNRNPEASAVFYVSATPRQLTDNLRRFLGGQGFPRGVLRMKEFSEASGASILDSDQQAYKLRVLEAVLLGYPQVRFTLFGDDGEQDPEIYAALQKKFPTQIEAIWIRRVDPNPARARFEGQGDTATLLVP